jgi:transcriptional regulator with XRE-family HTH domain
LIKSWLQFALQLAAWPWLCVNFELRIRDPQVRFLFALRRCAHFRLVCDATCHRYHPGAEVPDEGNPTLRRRELGFLLRKLRTDRGMSIDDATRQALFSPTKLSRLETGRVGASARDIRDLCDVYGVTGTVERERLMDLAREGKQRAWWQPYDLPYATYIGLEAEAASISNYDTNVVPGLLQVEGYARAIFEVSEPPYSPSVIDRQVEARIRRQALLARDEAPLLHFIVDEISLRRPVGGPAVMAEQLARIVNVAGMPKVTFQIIPLSVGAHPGFDSNFVIIELGTPMVNDVVYVEGPVGNIYLESGSELERYRRIFSRLQAMALSPRDSISLVARIADSYKGG